MEQTVVQTGGLKRVIQGIMLGFVAALHLLVLVLVILGSIND